MLSKDSEHFISVDEIIRGCFTMPKLGSGLKHNFKGLVQGCVFNILQIYLYLLNANVLGNHGLGSICGLLHFHMSTLQQRSLLFSFLGGDLQFSQSNSRGSSTFMSTTICPLFTLGGGHSLNQFMLLVF